MACHDFRGHRVWNSRGESGEQSKSSAHCYEIQSDHESELPRTVAAGTRAAPLFCWREISLTRGGQLRRTVADARHGDGTPLWLALLAISGFHLNVGHIISLRFAKSLSAMRSTRLHLARSKPELTLSFSTKA